MKLEPLILPDWRSLAYGGLPAQCVEALGALWAVEGFHASAQWMQARCGERAAPWNARSLLPLWDTQPAAGAAEGSQQSDWDVKEPSAGSRLPRPKAAAGCTQSKALRACDEKSWMLRAHRIIRAIALACLLTLPLSAAEPGARTSAMWVYKTEALMADPAACMELFAFCHARAITDLFWDTHYAGKGSALVIDPAPELHAFLREASAHGLRLHALTGDPSHVLPAHHERVLARVDATIDFNNAAPANERFAGVHFDIEPHGLPAWKNAAMAEKCELLTQLVEVNAKAVERLRTRAPEMRYGADITFWFDKANADGSPVYPVTFRGVTKDATKHLLDLADNVGIMSYRDKATGPNGIVSLVEKTIRYADTAKGKAYVGIKMARIGPAMEGFYGQTEEAMLKALEPVQTTFANDRGYAGLAFFMYGAYREMAR